VRIFSRTLGTLFALALPLTAAGCTHYAQPVRVTMQSLPPLSGRVKIETTIVPRSQKFKVAVLTFIDQTGRAQLVVDPIADMLTTELFTVRRFELYDRQDLVEQTHARSFERNQEARMTNGNAATTGNAVAAAAAARADSNAAAASAAADQKTAEQKNRSQGKVDGILLGYITSYKTNETEVPVAAAAADDPKKKGAKADPKAAAAPPMLSRESDGTGEFTLDFRIVNTLNSDRDFHDAEGGEGAEVHPESHNESLKELVVFGDSAKVRFKMKGGNIELDRADVSKIAGGIREKFPDFSERKINVTSRQDRMVSLSAGEKDGVKQGFTGYVVKHDDKTGVNRYLAEFVIINVFKEASTAVVVPDITTGKEAKLRLQEILGNISVGSEAVIK
jgi:hypothetical protein